MMRIRSRLFLLVQFVLIFLLTTSPLVSAETLPQSEFEVLGKHGENFVRPKITKGGICSESVTFTGNNNAEKVYGVLIEKGLAPHQAAGIIGNLYAESGILPKRKQSTDPSYQATLKDIDEAIKLNKADEKQGFGIGIAQWTSWNRLEGLLKKAQELNGDPLSLEVQIPFLYQELEGNGLKEIKAAGDVRQAAWIFLVFFERPLATKGFEYNPVQATSGDAKTELDKREKFANEQTGQPPVASGSTTSSSSTSSGSCEEAAEVKPQKILAIGDSMTAQHTDEKQFGKGWWGYLRDETNVPVVLSAQGGSGYIRKGDVCTGTTFMERIEDIKKTTPTFIVVAGGYNDGSYCKNGNATPSTPEMLQSGISEYMDKLLAEATSLGIPPADIYIWTPWGPDAEDKRKKIEPIVTKQAKRIGATYINVPSLTPKLSRDGIHPTPDGSKYFYDELVKRSDIKTKIKEAGASAALNNNTNTPSFKKNPAVSVDDGPTGSFNPADCTGGFTDGGQSLSKFVMGKFSPPVTSVGGYSCRANTAAPTISIHGLGRALDIMIDGTTPGGLETGNKIRNFMINNSTALGVQRVIWDRHIWSADQDGWRVYDGPNPHIDHLHVEINEKAASNPKLAG